MRSLMPTALATGVASLLLALLGPLPAAAVTPVCDGRPATIIGTPGGDRLYGTEADDVVWLGGATEGERDVFVDTAGGHDLVCQGGLGMVVVQAGDGDDVIHLAPTTSPEDIVFDGVHAYGQGGDDRIDTDGGFAFMYGGSGDDVLVGGTAEVWRGDVLRGGPGADTLTGRDGPDHLDGGDGDDTVDGGAEDDVLIGTRGSDGLEGGEGADTLAFSTAVGGRVVTQMDSGIQVDLGAGTVTSSSGTSTTSTVECVIGTPHPDVIDGSESKDCVDGGPGDAEDVVRGHGGADNLVISAGSVDGGDGNDRIAAGTPDQVLEDRDVRAAVTGGAGDDSIQVSGPRITVAGNDGADTILPGLVGSVEVTGGPGDDTLRMSSPAELDARTGTMTYPHDPRTDVTFSGTEIYRGSFGPDVMRGSGRDETFDGYRGEDRITAGGGADLLLGGAQRDVLLGGRGKDVADGQQAQDRCVAERRISCET